MSHLRVATAGQSRILDPFVDEVDGFSPETGLTINNTDINLFKNSAGPTSKNSGGASHEVNGVYSTTFDATDSATIGELAVSVKVSGARGILMRYEVISAAAYDALYGDPGPGFASAVICSEARLAELDAASLPAVTDAIAAAIVDLNDLSAAEVKAQLVEALDTDVYSLPGQVAIPLQPTPVEMLLFLYKRMRNPTDQTGGETRIYDDLGTTVDQKAAVSFVAGVVAKAKFEAGP